MSVLRIGINALYFLPGGVGGTEIYLRSLLRSLHAIDATNSYCVYVNQETGSELEVEAPRFHFVRCPIKASFRPSRILYEQVMLPILVARHLIDVLFNPGFTMPVLSRCRSVTVFHDLQHKRHPEFFRKLDIPFWTLLLWLAAVRSHSLIAVSPATAEDLNRYYPASGAKIKVIPHGVDTELFAISGRRSAERDRVTPYILSVATLHPHKNLARLLDAFHTFRESHPQYRLVIAGLKGLASDSLDERRARLGLNDYVEFTGWISRRRLYELYQGADAFIAPSLFEGFGLPLLEALAAGIPTACSAIPTFQWVGGKAVEYFDPKCDHSILEALQRVTTDADFRSRAAVEGPACARRFDWHDSAAQTLAEIKQVAHKR